MSEGAGNRDNGRNQPYDRGYSGQSQPEPSAAQVPGRGYAQPYGSAQYGSPLGQYQPLQAPTGKGLAITSLVLGIIAIVLGAIPFVGFFLFFVGIAAVVCGILNLVGHRPGKVMAIFGIILGALGVVVSLLGTLILIPLFVLYADENAADGHAMGDPGHSHHLLYLATSNTGSTVTPAAQ